MSLRDIFNDIDTSTNQFEEHGFMSRTEYLEIKERQEYYKNLERKGQEEELSA